MEPVRKPQVSERGTVEEGGGSHQKNFIGHMFKYAVFDVKRHTVIKFSSQMSHYTREKISFGRSGRGIPLAGARSDPPSLRSAPRCDRDVTKIRPSLSSPVIFVVATVSPWAVYVARGSARHDTGSFPPPLPVNGPLAAPPQQSRIREF